MAKLQVEAGAFDKSKCTSCLNNTGRGENRHHIHCGFWGYGAAKFHIRELIIRVLLLEYVFIVLQGIR